MSSGILIVGVGALGSHVAQFMRNRPEGLALMDHDRVESKNLAAQFHGRNSLGKNKTQAMAGLLTFMFNVRVSEAFPHRINESNADIVRLSRLVIDCTDNIKARTVIQETCLSRSVPCLHASANAEGDFGRVMWSEHFSPDAEQDGLPTCEGGDRVAFYGLVAAQTALVAQRWLELGDRISLHVLPHTIVRMA